jgi:hypothetical protein
MIKLNARYSYMDMRRKERKENLRKTLVKIVGPFLIAGSIAGYAIFDRIKYNNEQKLLESNISTVECQVEKGATYWKLSDNYVPEKIINRLGKPRVVNYIKNKLNHGKELITGQTAVMPVYGDDY